MSEATVFAAALEKPTPEERDAYLAEACAGDENLRRRVEALLRAHAESGDLPGLPPTGAYEPPAERPGSRVGPYKLMEQIGEGGFGLVFVAEQTEPVRRKVALKVIKPGMDSKQVIARFEAERQALALMDYPNIARVLDAGTTDSGRPYFVMELVRGVPITTYCDQNQLNPRERLELFVTVCQAIQHAHQKGVIHRDVKPSNVLVTSHDGKPVAKVIDFGVAKAIHQPLTDRTIYTNFAQMVGTPLYMSPEQAEMSGLDIDTRSDVYSLGVLLYELLTGSTPLERKRLMQAAYDEVRRLIREEEPPRPSERLSTSESLPSVAACRKTEPAKLTRLVRGELDWIVMRALEKDRTRRYETASGFARDVERYLADEPVEACPPTAGYRLRKFVRKHRATLTTTAVFVFLLALGGALSAWQAVRATWAQEAAEAARREAEAERDAKEQARKGEAAQRAAAQAAAERVRQALDTLTDDVIQNLFARQQELGEPEKAFLRKVQGLYEAFTREKGDDPAARHLRATGYYRLAWINSRLGQVEPALEQFRSANALWEGLAAEFPAAPDYRRALAASLDDMGGLLRQVGRLAEADAAVRAALSLREKLGAESPAAPEYRWQLARGYNERAAVLAELGRPPEAAGVIRAALTLLEKLAADCPAVPAYREELASTHYQLGILISGGGRRSEAEAEFRAARDGQEKLVGEFPANPHYRVELALSRSSLGNALTVLGRWPEAETEFRAALALEEKLVADFPAVPDYRRALAGSRVNFGHLLCKGGKLAEALSWYERALALLEPLHQAQPRDLDTRRFLRNAHVGRAEALDALGRPAEAARDWEQAIALSPAEERPRFQMNRAVSLTRTGRAAEAVKVAEPLLANPAADVATLYDGACVFALCAAATKNDPVQAKKYADRALELLRRVVAVGFRDAAHLKHDSDLAALRDRAEFRQLIAELEKQAPPKPKPKP